jgi:hypothetical protein
MRRILETRTSAALIIAITLILAAAVGGATAAGLITGKQIKNHSIQLVDLSKKAQLRLRGQRGQRGPQGVPGPQGPQGPAGPAGTSTPTPALAYAHVAADGTILRDSSGISQVNLTKTAKGQYCFKNLPSRLRNAVASPSGTAMSAVVLPGSTCRFTVRTFKSATNRVNAPFYIQFA